MCFVDLNLVTSHCIHPESLYRPREIIEVRLAAVKFRSFGRSADRPDLACAANKSEIKLRELIDSSNKMILLNMPLQKVRSDDHKGPIFPPIVLGLGMIKQLSSDAKLSPNQQTVL
jgi:hypothetical protein